MARLKSRDRFPPKGFSIIHPEAGMKQPVDNMSFREAVQWEMQFRHQNPHLVKRYNWPTSQGSIEIFVDESNAARCLAMGLSDWVETGEATASYVSSAQKKSVGEAVAGKVRRVVTGVALLHDWLGEGGNPVAGELAEKRASICSDCPKNDGGDFTAYFTTPISKQIRAMLELKHSRALQTTHDNRLTVCSACDCPLKLKVWAPLQHINAHMSAVTRTRLDPRCWVLQETGA